MKIEGKRHGLDLRLMRDWYDWGIGVNVSYNRPVDDVFSGHVCFDAYIGPITLSLCYYWWPK